MAKALVKLTPGVWLWSQHPVADLFWRLQPSGYVGNGDQIRQSHDKLVLRWAIVFPACWLPDDGGRLMILPVDQTLETASSKDRRAHRFEPPSFLKIYLKNLQKNRAAPLRPIALQRPSQVTEPPNTKSKKKSQGTVQCLSHSVL